MLPKPAGCLGCPLYGDGLGFVPDHIVPEADTMIVMQNPGATEEQHELPACGDTGELMNGTFIPLALLERTIGHDPGTTSLRITGNVSVGNILKCRWTNAEGKKTNDLPPAATLEVATQHCTSSHLVVPDSAKVIIAQGALAFKYFSDEGIKEADGKTSSSTSWRGFTLPPTHDFEGKPVYIVGHLADIFRDPKQRWIAEQDWKRIAALRAGNWPRSIPDRTIVTSIDDWGDGYEWFQQAIRDKPTIICDTEFGIESRYLTVIGLGYYRGDGSVCGLQIDLREPNSFLREQVEWQMKRLVQVCPMVFHNAIADTMILDQNLGIKYADYRRVDDTMLAHSALWGELPHTLDFCASIYSDYPRLKHLASEDLIYYNWGDVIATLCVWRELSHDLKYDTGASAIYHTQLLKLIPILAGAKARGIRVNHQRVLQVQPALAAGMDAAERLARVGSGKPFNLGSDDQLKDWLYRRQDYPLQRNKDTKRPTTDDDAIGVLREVVGPPFDPKVDLTVDMAVDRILAGADPILESRVLYVQHEHILNNYIFPLHKGKKNGGHKNKSKHNRQLRISGVWNEHDLVSRVFPDIATHVQKSGRHSTSNPPLAQLPAEYRDIIAPDKGCLWIKWDWSAIEPRLLEALCGSRILKRSFDDGIDLHTWTVCEIFGYPQPVDLINPHKCKCGTGVCEHEQWRQAIQWKGKDDPRRVFAKSGRYEVWYGGTGSNAALAAARFGLDKRELKHAVQKLASSDTDYYRWRCGIEAEVKRTRLIRSWGGRPRRLLGQGSGVIREALNHPMQAGVSDIYNLTMIELYETYKQIQYVFGMHDSQWWQINCQLFTPILFQGIKRIVEQERNINGVIRAFPADFELTDEWSNHYGKSHQYTIEDYFAGARYV